MECNECNECLYKFETMTCPCGWFETPIGLSFGGYAMATIDDYPLDMMRELLGNLKNETTTKSILLIGPSGAGKTHCAIALAKWLYVSNGMSAGFIDHLSDLPSERDKQIHEHISYHDVLIIDEFNNKYFDIVNGRIRGGKITICTTNAELDTIDKRFGWRLTPYKLEYNLTDDKPKRKRDKIIAYDQWKSWIDAKDMENVINTINDTSFYGFTGMAC